MSEKKITKEPEPTIYERSLYRSPGPKYDAPNTLGPKASSIYKTHQYQYSFGRRPLVLVNNTVPGPDKYAHQTSTLGGIKWSMRAKPFEMTSTQKEDTITG
jgi:hypothetical protein